MIFLTGFACVSGCISVFESTYVIRIEAKLTVQKWILPINSIEADEYIYIVFGYESSVLYIDNMYCQIYSNEHVLRSFKICVVD